MCMCMWHAHVHVHVHVHVQVCRRHGEAAWSRTNCSWRRYMRASSVGCLTLPAFSRTCSVLSRTCGAVAAGAASEERRGRGRRGGRGGGGVAAHFGAQPVLQGLHARLGLPRVRLRVRELLRHLRHVWPPAAHRWRRRCGPARRLGGTSGAEWFYPVPGAAHAPHVVRRVVGGERLVRECRRLVRRLGVARLRRRAVGRTAASAGGTQCLSARPKAAGAATLEEAPSSTHGTVAGTLVAQSLP